MSGLLGIGPRVFKEYPIADGYKVIVTEWQHPYLDKMLPRVLATRELPSKIATAYNDVASYYNTTDSLEDAYKMAERYVEYARAWLAAGKGEEWSIAVPEWGEVTP